MATAKKGLTSYDNVPEDYCWHDECNCETILAGDCDALVNENNKGVGRYACMAEDQDCYNPKFFSSFMKKLTCQLDHIIQNICGLWDMVECIISYIKQIGDLSAIKVNYARNSAVSSATFYRPIIDEYIISLWMDSKVGHEHNHNDDGLRKLTDRPYRAYIRWCADGTGLVPNQDNTMMFTVFHSGETLTDDMVRQRSVHWQMSGVRDGAMEMSDTIILPKGTYIRLQVNPENGSQGTFRVHQFKVEYTPIIDTGTLPECLK